jgi:hypothetical protein
MRSIFHHPAEATPISGSDGQIERLGRLAALSVRQRNQALRFLSGFAPEVFDAVLGEVGPGRAAVEGMRDEYEPACAFCAQRVGIFTWFGPDLMHYRGAQPGGPFELADPGHDPVLTWRPAADGVLAS